MQLQFPNTSCTWLGQAGGDTKDLEQTLEVRLTDDLPDIGRVLCGWGQALVRSKQWSRDSIGISGGVMAWVLYQPEDGSEVRSVECWIPFQNRWDIAPQEHDGAIWVQCYLKGVDGRSLSARKLMVRASVSVCARAMAEVSGQLYTCGECPQDVQLLKKTWELLLPREAGEKTVNLEEQIAPPSGPAPRKILHYSLNSVVSDCKLMADRAVFRGNVLGQSLYSSDDGSLHSWDFQVPFSQYTELDREYGPDARLQVAMLPTGLEMELSEDGHLHMKASLVGQYMIFDRQMLETVTDAYSTQRELTLENQTLELPQVIALPENSWHVGATGGSPASQVLGCSFWADAPRAFSGVPAELAGRFQVLCRDSDGQLRCDSLPWQDRWELSEDSLMWVWQSAQPNASAGAAVSAQTELSGSALSQTVVKIPMVTALTLGAERQKPEDRPSVILRRSQGDSLWETAKANATTMEQIMQANGLTEAPPEGSWLLIPVP